jgi:hypothetical protein
MIPMTMVKTPQTEPTTEPIMVARSEEELEDPDDEDGVP